MVESNVLQLTEKHLVTNHISLYIGYYWTKQGFYGKDHLRSKN